MVFGRWSCSVRRRLPRPSGDSRVCSSSTEFACPAGWWTAMSNPGQAAWSGSHREVPPRAPCARESRDASSTRRRLRRSRSSAGPSPPPQGPGGFVAGFLSALGGNQPAQTGSKQGGIPAQRRRHPFRNHEHRRERSLLSHGAFREHIRPARQGQSRGTGPVARPRHQVEQGQARTIAHVAPNAEGKPSHPFDPLAKRRLSPRPADQAGRHEATRSKSAWNPRKSPATGLP